MPYNSKIFFPATLVEKILYEVARQTVYVKLKIPEHVECEELRFV